MVGERRCRKCGSGGPFGKHKGCKGGFLRDCLACHALARAERRRVKGDALRAYARAWYAANKEHCREKAREQAKKRSREVVMRVTAWRKANPEAHNLHNRAYKHRRRALRRSAEGWANPTQIAARIAYYGHRCAYCRGPYEDIDHVIPLSRGGSNWPANLRPACKRCNNDKRAKLPSEWDIQRRAQ